MKSEVEHAHALDVVAAGTTPRLVVLGVMATLTAVGLQSAASAAVRSPDRGKSDLQGETTKSSLAHRHGDKGSYVEMVIVSDRPGVAPVTDPNLVNPWGIAFGPTTPLWVANNGPTWRAELGIADPSPQLDQAISLIDDLVRVAKSTAALPTPDAVLTRLADRRRTESRLERLVNRVLGSAIEQRQARQAMCEALKSHAGTAV